MDVTLFTAINGTHAPALDALMLAATWAGFGAVVWFALAAVALCWPRHRAAAVRAVLLLAVTLGVNNLVVKPLVDRPRPFSASLVAARVIQVPAPTTTSFPSGHAATAVAGAMAMARVWPAARVGAGRPRRAHRLLAHLRRRALPHRRRRRRAARRRLCAGWCWPDGTPRRGRGRATRRRARATCLDGRAGGPTTTSARPCKPSPAHVRRPAGTGSEARITVFSCAMIRILCPDAGAQPWAR